MNKANVLTKSIAEQFLANSESVDLRMFPAIEDDAAAVLGASDSVLELDGLAGLSDAAADGLSKAGGSLLSMNGLTGLSDAAAKALGRFRGELALDGISDISSAACLSLMKGEGGRSLKGLVSIEDSVAKRFAETDSWPELRLKTFPSKPGHIALAKAIAARISHNVDATERLEIIELPIAEAFAATTAHLAFPAAQEISLDVAKALAKHKKGNLRLYSIEHVSEAVAAALAQHGPKLFMANLSTLDNTKGHKKLLQKLVKSKDDAEFGFSELPLWLAEELLKLLAKAKYSGRICFPKLQAICPKVFRMLCDYRVEGYSPPELLLDGLRQLPENAAEAIGAHSGTLSLCGVEEISDAVAEGLGMHRGRFDVSGLRRLTRYGAEQLAKTAYDLYLNHLDDLDADVASALARHGGKRMTLNGERHLSPVAIRELAVYAGGLTLGLESLDAEQGLLLSSHQNELEVDSVRELDVAAARHLASHQHLVSLKSLVHLSVDAARELAKHPGPLRVVLDNLPNESAAVLRKAFPMNMGVELRK